MLFCCVFGLFHGYRFIVIIKLTFGRYGMGVLLFFLVMGDGRWEMGGVCNCEVESGIGGRGEVSCWEGEKGRNMTMDVMVEERQVYG